MTPHIDISQHWFLFLIPIFLYAEIHYRIAGIFSRYFRREPEIIADAPSRLAPGKKLPVFLCIKDAHLFPISLDKVEISIVCGAEDLLIKEKPFDSTPILDSMWTDLLDCDLPSHVHGDAMINVVITYFLRGKKKSCINDNYTITSHKPFKIFIDQHPRPGLDGWYFGDMHTHSHLTSDQVEFGAPFEATAAIARAMELDFFASADHSYDLDDRPDNYLVNDANLSKWKLLWERIERWNNAHKDLLIIPGEELSASNSKNQNVHFLVFNNRHFFKGSGDSAEQWLRTKAEHSIEYVLSQLEHKALAFASHPEIKPPFLQRLLLRRGQWAQEDYNGRGLHGVQMWNGDKEHFLKKGLPKWIIFLLKGRKLALIAGTDAHGNFNRFRQIGLPHFSMIEKDDEVFGTALTGVFIEDDFTFDALTAALKNGRTIVTDGPIATMTYKFEHGKARIGDSTSATAGTLIIRAFSTPHFGEIQKIKLIIGDVRTKKETQSIVKTTLGSFNFTKEIFIETAPRPGYIRLELTTGSDRLYHCFTNPIYFN